MREKYALKSPIFGLKPRCFALKPFNLSPQIWFVSAVFFEMIRFNSVQKQYREWRNKIAV